MVVERSANKLLDRRAIHDEKVLTTSILLFLLTFHTAIASAAEPAANLKPLLAQPDKIVLQHDFSSTAQLTKESWREQMGTRWKIADGVLRGIPSTPDYQASKPDHKGFEPRINCPVTPDQVIAAFSIRFTGGSETFIVPFFEFNHHVARVKFTKDSVFLLADHDSLKVAETKTLKYEPGRWYHCLAELKGEEFVVQFADGPTLYARHPSYALPPPSGAPGMAVAGPKDGTAEIDNVTLWSIKPAVQPGWVVKRSTFPKFEPVRVKEKVEKPVAPSNANTRKS